MKTNINWFLLAAFVFNGMEIHAQYQSYGFYQFEKNGAKVEIHLYDSFGGKFQLRRSSSDTLQLLLGRFENQFLPTYECDSAGICTYVDRTLFYLYPNVNRISFSGGRKNGDTSMVYFGYGGKNCGDLKSFISSPWGNEFKGVPFNKKICSVDSIKNPFTLDSILEIPVTLTRVLEVRNPLNYSNMIDALGRQGYKPNRNRTSFAISKQEKASSNMLLPGL
ncbi:MAG: hypothetical protein JWO30_3182 [Fibrobacteres bacterium]|nr:hypothetical protein [Fibrobacterota bacterium]